MRKSPFPPNDMFPHLDTVFNINSYAENLEHSKLGQMKDEKRNSSTRLAAIPIFTKKFITTYKQGNYLY